MSVVLFVNTPGLLQGKLIRHPTPYPKEMREKNRHVQNLAMRKRMVGGSVTWNDGAENKAFSDGEVTHVLSYKIFRNKNQNWISSCKLFSKKKKKLFNSFW